MRAHRTGITGSAGNTEVKAEFERLGQGPIEVPQEHDLGLDLIVQVRDERGSDAGLLFGVQVKSGSASEGTAYFAAPQRGSDGRTSGWWYRAEDSRHFDSWIRHDIPVILVLRDLDARTSYWVEIDPASVRSTGKGHKIFVPADQTISRSALPGLFEVATSKRGRQSWEGSAWSRKALRIAPADRLRHALLVPRLIAPHRNAGFGSPVDPAEAVALLIQHRISDLHHFAEAHVTVSALDDASSHKDWHWRFVAAFSMLINEDSPEALVQLIPDAPHEAARVAATVTASYGLLSADRHTEAAELLNSEISRDQAEPADHAWLLVHRAWARSELGDPTRAAEDAALARITVLLAPTDPTTSALAAAAAESIFRAAPLGSEDLEEFITSSDTAASWWRSQDLAGAYGETVKQDFTDWAQQGTIRLFNAPPAYSRLAAARHLAAASAHIGTWRACASLEGRQLLLDATRQPSSDSPEELIRYGLKLLQQSGDSSSLVKAVHRLCRLGPLSPLTEHVRSMPTMPGPTRSYKALWELWRTTGDLLSEPEATAAAGHCLGVLTGRTPVPEDVAKHSVVPYFAARALRGLLEAASLDVHHQARDFIVEHGPWKGSSIEAPLTSIVGALSDESLTDPRNRSLWLERALSWTADSPDEVALAMLGRLPDDTWAVTALTDLAEGGNASALAALGSVAELSGETVHRVVSHLSSEVRSLVAQLDTGTWPMLSRDVGYNLAVLNINHPVSGNWQDLADLLAHPRATGDHVHGACAVLARGVVSMPQHARDVLVPAVQRLRVRVDSGVASYAPPGFTPVGSPVLRLAAALGLLASEEFESRLVRLLSGGHNERLEAVAQLHGRQEGQVTLDSSVAVIA
ncbi:DUF4365 domain-containing protein [Streptomyces sp. NPDC058442]|uniref:DUF4365 domain-containing protein n=1 Tax=Streptomyces sp. NPDC058442 TaxID=3346503 RepID=UPI0036612C7E